jgi:phosphoglycerol transferase MdoB-like AlkP superfamily enzyme
MTDQTVGLPAAPAKPGYLRALAGRAMPRRQMRPATAWAISALLLAILLRHFWLDEGELPNILFTVAVTGALIAVVLAISTRAFFATVVIASLVAAIVAAAAAKRAVMNMVVHAYDLFFYLSSWSTISYLWADQRRYMLAALAAASAMAIAGWLAYRLDSTRVGRRWSALMLAAFVALAWWGAYSKGERRHMQFYYSNLYVSSFYASWAETLEAVWRGALLEAAPHANSSARPFTIPTRCQLAARPPHIILIHQESVVQPSLFASLRYDRSIDPFFRSDDQGLHQLRVETYGGASWLTEFSLLAGVSTHSFGGMRQFVQTFTQNKLKDTVPQVLERCGYRNVVFYPLLKNFVSNDRFYASIGLKEIVDMKAQGAKTAQERDRFYFDNAMAEMGRHFDNSRQPMFTFIQTMSAHWPYNVTYAPEVDVPGGGPGTDPEMSEYLRRLAMAKMDFEYLVAELRRRFPQERFLIMHYGDHHPMATRTLLGFKDETEAEDVTLDPNSIGFVTYYAVRGINYKVPVLPRYDSLDVSYLGTLLLDLAGMPLSDSHLERKRLMAACRGRYYSCANRDEILQFHRRLIDAGVVAAN